MPTDKVVCIVEDKSELREAMQMMVQFTDGFVLGGSYANAEEALKLIPELQPDAVLMDINLPGISGIEALKILRSDPATSQIPVIALSANAMPRDVEKGLQAGFFRYLTKPIKANDLYRKLKKWLQPAQVELEAA